MLTPGNVQPEVSEDFPSSGFQRGEVHWCHGGGQGWTGGGPHLDNIISEQIKTENVKCNECSMRSKMLNIDSFYKHCLSIGWLQVNKTCITFLSNSSGCSSCLTITRPEMEKAYKKHRPNFGPEKLAHKICVKISKNAKNCIKKFIFLKRVQTLKISTTKKN